MIIYWILTGLFAGWLATLVVGEDRGCATSIVVGMIGSLIGGAVEMFLRTGSLTLNLAFTDFNLTSIIVSTLGAIVLLGLLNLFKR
jgi:uncharacterized membrane protein YeaQ/YmgE (transglycosylase-associated protein family)